ncbi:MAG TPA: hypothetical protein VJ204_03470, partial [Solirubrobacterales bacterium]|nr:hypothetical protein [Solirubrobacterales bacterium]
MRFAFDLSPGAAGDPPGCRLESLLAFAVVLKGRRGVVKFAAVGFDDQSSIAPEEVGLQWLAARDVEPHVDLRLRQVGADAQAEEESLEVAARPLRLRVKGVDNESQSSDATAPPTAPKDRSHRLDVENAKNL